MCMYIIRLEISLDNKANCYIAYFIENLNGALVVSILVSVI